MENEVRYYLGQILKSMQTVEKPFVPQVIVTAVKLPAGNIEVALNTTHIDEKITYILSAYDDDMHLKTNPDVVMQNLMVV